MTNAEALFTIAAAVLVGMAAGALIRRRSAVPLVPAVFVVVLELARLPLVGPTVDPQIEPHPPPRSSWGPPGSPRSRTRRRATGYRTGRRVGQPHRR